MLMGWAWSAKRPSGIIGAILQPRFPCRRPISDKTLNGSKNNRLEPEKNEPVAAYTLASY